MLTANPRVCDTAVAKSVWKPLGISDFLRCGAEAIPSSCGRAAASVAGAGSRRPGVAGGCWKPRAARGVEGPIAAAGGWGLSWVVAAAGWKWGRGAAPKGERLDCGSAILPYPLYVPVSTVWSGVRKSSASRCLSREQGRALGTKRYSWWLKAGGWSPHASVGVSWLQSDRGHLQGQTAMLVCIRAPWPARGRGPAVADHPEET